MEVCVCKLDVAFVSFLFEALAQLPSHSEWQRQDCNEVLGFTRRQHLDSMNQKQMQTFLCSVACVQEMFENTTKIETTNKKTMYTTQQ